LINKLSQIEERKTNEKEGMLFPRGKGGLFCARIVRKIQVIFMDLKKLKNPKMIDFLKSENGFSLMELMVAAGLVGILSTGIFQTIQNATHVSYRGAQKVEIFQIIGQINSIFKNKEKCSKTLKGLNPVKGTFLKEIGRVKTEKFYGQGGGRVKLLTMELKNFNKETSTSDLELIFQRYIGGDKKVVKEKKVLKVMTHLNPQDIPEAERGDPEKIKDCLTNTDNYIRDSCEASFQGDYSNQKNCKSLTIETSSKKDFAINAEGMKVSKGSNDNNSGDILVSGNTKGKEQGVLNNLTTYGDIKIGDGENKVGMSLISNPNALTLMGFKNELKSFKIETQRNNRKVHFSVDNKKNLIIDGRNSFDFLKVKSTNQDSFEPNNFEGVISTRQWSYETLANFFKANKYTKGQFNNFLADEIEQLGKVDNDKVEAAMAKAIGKHICSKYFKSFEWTNDGNCKPKISCSDDQLLTVKVIDGVPTFKCEEFPQWSCVNITTKQGNNSAGKCYRCGVNQGEITSCM